MRGGKAWRTLRRITSSLLVAGLVGSASLFTTAQLLVQQAETSLTRVPVPELDTPVETIDARHFLIVGSDARDEVGREDRDELPLGEFEGQRSDVIIYVAISEDRSAVSLVSLPRDLLVLHDGRYDKITNTFAGGPDELVRVIRENFGLPINHYVAVSLGGFIEVVRTLGSVQICLDDPLVDPKSGADFTEGCHQMDATESLAYVRSRSGARSDFARIDRQQNFIKSVLAELTEARILANPRRVFQLVEDLSSNLTTDEALGPGQTLALADEMRDVLSAGLPMTTVPAHPRRIDGVDYMVPYGPGARALFDALVAGRPVEDRGTADQRADITVAVYADGRFAGAEIVRSTLAWAGFDTDAAASGPAARDDGEVTTVFTTPDSRRQAEWVAATLGAPLELVGVDVTLPDGVSALVTVGADAQE